MAQPTSRAGSVDEMKEPAPAADVKEEKEADAPSPSSRFLLHGAATADIFLYTQVRNTAELLSLFHRQKLGAALLNPALLPDDVFPLLCALVKTTLQAQRKQLKAKSAVLQQRPLCLRSSSALGLQQHLTGARGCCRDVYNELAFNLSPSTHVSTSSGRAAAAGEGPQQRRPDSRCAACVG